ncbi:MAG: DUF4835 family protein [Nonlabens sp.]
MKYLRELISVLILLVFAQLVKGQELNVTVTVNAQNVAQPNQPIFKTLETSLQDFLNNTKWTQEEYQEEERISCSLTFIVNSYSNDLFSGNFQLALSRPVHDSAYTTQTFIYKDDDISFQYAEFAPLFYNSNQYESNLLSIVTFYAYVFLGIDADTFALKGGEEYYREAQRIANLAQGNSRAQGWNPNDGLISRFRLMDDMLLDTFEEYRQVMYEYHREGLDTFAQDPKAAKEKIKNSILKLNELNRRRPNSFLLRVFFDSKADEISNIFTGGPAINIAELKNSLQRLAPTQSSKWRPIKV